MNNIILLKTHKRMSSSTVYIRQSIIKKKLNKLYNNNNEQLKDT